MNDSSYSDVHAINSDIYNLERSSESIKNPV